MIPIFRAEINLVYRQKKCGADVNGRHQLGLNGAPQSRKPSSTDSISQTPQISVCSVRF